MTLFIKINNEIYLFGIMVVCLVLRCKEIFLVSDGCRNLMHGDGKALVELK